jgi:hypothetical protein
MRRVLLVASVLGLFMFSAGSALAAVTVVVSPTHMNGWTVIDDNGNGGSVSFVNGPGSPPAGSGSARFGLTASNQGMMLALGRSAQLSSITQLKYSTYRASFDAANNLTPTMQLLWDNDTTDADNGFKGRLVFEPLYAFPGGVPQNTWQEWDALTADAWWATNATFAASCSPASPCTWSDILTNWPNAGFHPTLLGGVAFKAGSGLSSFDANVDNFKISDSAGDQVFNFEADAPQTIVVAPSSMNGWVPIDDNGNGGTISFVNGPDTAPLGDGSARFQLSSSAQGMLLATTRSSKFSSITTLKYSTYRASFDAANNLAPSMQLTWDDDTTDLDNSFKGRLVYEPVYAAGPGSVPEDTWQEWDTLTGPGWYATDPAFTPLCSTGSPCTWAQVLTNWPSSGFRAGVGGPGFKAGSGIATFDGNVDAFKIADSAGSQIYDFEPETNGRITIVLQTHPEGSQAFSFTGTNGIAPFTLVDNGSPSNIETFNVPAGLYVFRVGDVPKWALIKLTCNLHETILKAHRLVQIQLHAGESVTCTFTESRRKPDAKIAPASSGPYSGENIYSSSVLASQTLTQAMTAGETKSFFARFQNDGLDKDYFRVVSTLQGSLKFHVVFLSGTIDITGKVNAGTYRFSLAPGAQRTIEIRVTADPTLGAADMRNITLTLQSRTAPAAKDLVRAVVN